MSFKAYAMTLLASSVMLAGCDEKAQPVRHVAQPSNTSHIDRVDWAEKKFYGYHEDIEAGTLIRFVFDCTKGDLTRITYKKPELQIPIETTIIPLRDKDAYDACKAEGIKPDFKYN